MYFRKLTTNQTKIKGIRKFDHSSTLAHLMCDYVQCTSLFNVPFIIDLKNKQNNAIKVFSDHVHVHTTWTS